MLCQVDTTTNNAYDISGTYNASLAKWSQAVVNGTNVVSLVLNNGGFCQTISQPRIVTVNFVCFANQVTPIIAQINEPQICIYNVFLRTNLACPSSTGNVIQRLKAFMDRY